MYQKNYENALAHVLTQLRHCKVINKYAGIEGKFVKVDEKDPRAVPLLMSVSLALKKFQRFF